MRRAARLRAGAAWCLALVLTGLVGACTAGGGQPGAAAQSPAGVAAQAFLTAWAEGRDEEAARLTDDPARAKPVLEQVRRELRIAAMTARAGAVTPAPDGTPTAAYDMSMRLTGLGEWSYPGRLALVETDAGGARRWLVRWSPAAVHPRLDDETRLGRTRSLLPRAPILDRAGKPLMSERPIVSIGVEPRRLTDRKRAYAALGKLGVDEARLAERVKAARPDEYVPVVELREAQFLEMETRLRAVRGLVFRTGNRTLAPTAAYGRALLGRVRPATKETLEAAGPLALSNDQVGSSGLQLAFQNQLAGEPAGAVNLVSDADGEVRETLQQFPGKPGDPLATTLDGELQADAERVLARIENVASLVAVKPSTGEVLAAANSAVTGSYNNAFVGRYEPGSTFKIVTTAALLLAGVSPAQVVPCPGDLLLGGKRFENYDKLGGLGDIPFHTAFAESCNTAFVASSQPLADVALRDVSAQLGMGATWPRTALGVDAFSGDVPVTGGEVERAAASIGQGKVLSSPLAMAMVAAAVQSGAVRPPMLLSAPPAASPSTEPTPPAAMSLPPEVTETLRALMREAVTAGTAKALRMPGEPVAAKTGTAEYGNEEPRRKHAWMVGFRGDLAFAVLVENGETGAKTAGPIARAFLTG